MDSKKCSGCKIVKSLSEYYKNRSRKDGYGNYCKVCDKRNKQKSYSENKEARLAGVAIRKAVGRKMVIDAKAAPCMDCGISYPPYVMDFDHRPGVTKLFKVSLMHGFSLSKLQEEIDKCDLVCANCHRERTWRRSKEE